MLVGGGVEHHGGPVPQHDGTHARAVAHVGDHARMRRCACGARQFLLDRVKREFAVVEQYQPRRAEACNLAHQFRTDRATRAGDEHGLAGQQRGQAGVVEHHRIAPQQVVQIDPAHCRHLHLAAHQVGQ